MVEAFHVPPPAINGLSEYFARYTAVKAFPHLPQFIKLDNGTAIYCMRGKELTAEEIHDLDVCARTLRDSGQPVICLLQKADAGDVQSLNRLFFPVALDREQAAVLAGLKTPARYLAEKLRIPRITAVCAIALSAALTIAGFGTFPLLILTAIYLTLNLRLANLQRRFLTDQASIVHAQFDHDQQQAEAHALGSASSGNR